MKPCIVIILALALVVSGHEPLSDEIISYVNAKGRTWTAAKNKLNWLPLEDVKRMLGVPLEYIGKANPLPTQEHIIGDIPGKVHAHHVINITNHYICICAHLMKTNSLKMSLTLALLGQTAQPFKMYPFMAK